jgi:MYXO-CTERM domain-containing protein
MSSRARLAFPLAVLTAFALLGDSPRAEACSPPPSGVFSTIPAEGQKYPGNAAVILQGQGISLTDASVTVDGQPATLKDVSKTLFSDLGIFAVAVEPAPAAGQSVVITGTFCAGGSGCPPVKLTYQATAADTVAPTPIDLVGFDIHDYTDFKSSGGDCQNNSDYAWWVELKTQVPDQAVDGAVLYRIEGYVSGTQPANPDVWAVGYVDDTGHVVVPIRWTVDILGNKPLPEAMCFRVVAYDTAGNTPSTSPETYCKPCHYRADGIPGNGFPPAEPAWTPADIYSGGTCDSSIPSTGSSGIGGGVPHGTGSSSGAGGGSGGGTSGDQVVGGCGCSVAGDDQSPTGLFGALALAIGASLRLARRRRR